ncbi:uncharacterized protein [Battus philenor]|uniref:uncharacterized protein n=1 Tax=Battus philenor TaxID=42288 RepID=UPI0035D03288
MGQVSLLRAVLLFGILANAVSKIVLPHKLRYLENMLNAEVIAKATKLRQRMEANPNIQESDKNWPLLLAKYQTDEKYKQLAPYSYKNMYGRRIPNLR